MSAPNLLSVRDIPKPHELWERPPQQKVGNQDDRDLFLAVGMALTEWEKTESAYARFFAILMHHGGIQSPAERVYGSIISPGGRREALEAAAEVFFHWHDVTTEDRADFKQLLNHHQKATARRNDIGHGVVGGIMPNTPNEGGKFLRPAMYNTGKNRDFFIEAKGKEPGEFDIWSMQDYAYTASDIEQFRQSFKTLGTVTLNHAFDFNGVYVTRVTPRANRQFPRPHA